ncbi:hypothetical protein PFISCL1PPCAC_11993, partial [Pristionchus fissidentatus]
LEIPLLLSMAHYCLDDTFTKINEERAAIVGGVLLVASTLSASFCVHVFEIPQVKLPIILVLAIDFFCDVITADFKKTPFMLAIFVGTFIGVACRHAWDFSYFA